MKQLFFLSFLRKEASYLTSKKLVTPGVFMKFNQDFDGTGPKKLVNKNLWKKGSHIYWLTNQNRPWIRNSPLDQSPPSSLHAKQIKNTTRVNNSLQGLAPLSELAPQIVTDHATKRKCSIGAEAPKVVQVNWPDHGTAQTMTHNVIDLDIDAVLVVIADPLVGLRI